MEAAIKARDYPRAETLLVQEIERNPKSSQLLTLRGGVSFSRWQVRELRRRDEESRSPSPLDDRNRLTLPMAYVINHRDWARPEFEKLAQADPRNALYPYWLSHLDYDAMQFDAAVVNPRKATRPTCI